MVVNQFMGQCLQVRVCLSKDSYTSYISFPLVKMVHNKEKNTTNKKYE